MNNETDIGVIACYRPESINCQLFYDKLEQHTLELVNRSTNILVIGDLNTNMLETQTSTLSEFMSSYGFENTIRSGTRFNANTRVWTLLDVILTLCMDLFVLSQVFPTSFSDHALVISAFKYAPARSTQQLLESRCLNKTKLQPLAETLKSYHFDHLIHYNDVNAIWIEIKNIILTALDAIAPVKMIRIKPNGVEWFDGDLLKVQKKREYFHNKFLRTNDENDHNKYIEYRNRFTSLFRHKKANYYKSMLDEYGTSSRSLWTKLFPILNPNKKSKLNVVNFEGRLYSAPIEIADLFLSIFSTSLAAFNHTPIANCLGYIRNHFSSHRLVDPMFNSCLNLFQFVGISPPAMISRLKKLDKSSAPGASSIPTKVLIHCATELALPLSILFNKCVSTSRFPDELKIAHITPIFKGKGDKNDAENYRPISVLSPVGKLFEKILTEQLTDHLEGNYLLNRAQHGFRRGLSCETALNTIVENWRASIDDRKSVVAVFLDLKKAFDTINHDLLLYKLNYYNISHKSINLISSYLHDRCYAIRYSGAQSDFAKLGLLPAYCH